MIITDIWQSRSCKDYALQDPNKLISGNKTDIGGVTLPSNVGRNANDKQDIGGTNGIAGGAIPTGEMADYLMLLAALGATAAVWGACLVCRVTCCRPRMTRVSVWRPFVLLVTRCLRCLFSVHMGLIVNKHVFYKKHRY